VNSYGLGSEVGGASAYPCSLHVPSSQNAGPMGGQNPKAYVHKGGVRILSYLYQKAPVANGTLLNTVRLTALNLQVDSCQNWFKPPVYLLLQAPSLTQTPVRSCQRLTRTHLRVQQQAQYLSIQQGVGTQGQSEHSPADVDSDLAANWCSSNVELI
jgi:hypothetical protein